MLIALHGRERLARHRHGRHRLALLIVAAFAALVLAKLGEIVAVDGASHARWVLGARQIEQLRVPLQCAAPILAGVLIDRFGPRRVVALGLIAWCGLLVVGAATLSALPFALAAPVGTDILVGLIPVAALVCVRRALSPRRRGVAVVLVLVACGVAEMHPYTLYATALEACGGDHRTLAFVIGTLGSLVTGIWLLNFRDVDTDAGIDLRADPHASGGVGDVVSRPIVWGLSLILLCRAGAFALAVPFWTITLLRQAALDWTALVPGLTAALVSVAAAGWSDQLLRRSRSLSQARSPFIFLGFVALALLGFAETRPHQSALALALFAGAALGAIRLGDIVAVDLAPRPLAGRFLGFILSLEAVVSFYVTPIFSTLAFGDTTAKTIAIMMTGIAGAAITLLLLRRLTLDTA